MTSSSPHVSATSGFSEKEQKNETFKPVQEKSNDDLTLENLRASKLTKNTDSGEVRAPGIFERVKEEVEAIAEAIQEDHLHHKSSGNQGP